MSVALLEDAPSALPPPQGSPLRYTGEILLRTRPKTYRRVVHLLAEPNASVNAISQLCKVSEHTVNAVARRSAAQIEERKREMVAILSDVSYISAARVMDTVGKASCRDAAVATGITIDKTLALLGQGAAVQVAVVNVRSDAERSLDASLDAKLDAIARRLDALPVLDRDTSP